MLAPSWSVWSMIRWSRALCFATAWYFRKIGEHWQHTTHQSSQTCVSTELAQGGQCYHCSAQQCDVKPDSLHEQVDVTKTLTGHLWGKCFALADGLHDSVPGKQVSVNADRSRVNSLLYADDQSLLLLRACSSSNSCQELPNVHVISCVDRSRENAIQQGF
jgi:hypothetical protein